MARGFKDGNEVREDRRDHQRFELKLKAKLSLWLPGNIPSEVGSVRTIDISSGGVGFSRTAKQFVVLGANAELAISWPILLNNETPLNLIVWGKIIRNETQDGKKVAVVFMARYEFRIAGSPGSSLLR